MTLLQQPAPSAQTATPADAGRPPTSLGRGVLPAPSWVVASIAVAMALLIIAFFALRTAVRRKRERERRIRSSVAPPSSRPPVSSRR